MLDVKHLTKRFGNRVVIEDLSFFLPRGERRCLLAPSGAGKTSLIRILTGLDRSFTGTFHISTRRRTTLFQEPGLFWYKTVEENIFYPFQVQGISINQAVRDRYAEWLTVTGLTGVERHYPYQLSGGMKQKAALIRGFLPGPELVFMDEPFKSIDTASKQEIINYLTSRYPDLTAVLVTHSLEEIPLMAHSLMVFSGQRLGDARCIRLSANDGYDRVCQAVSEK